MALLEDLRNGDLENLVKKVFTIDTYKPNTGDENDIVTLSFEVVGKEAADDLVNFVENGYSFVIDANSAEGEGKEKTYTVFVDLQREKNSAKNIEELLYGIGQLTNIEDWEFLYYKETKAKPIEKLKNVLPTDSGKYQSKIKKVFEDDISFFFRKSPLDYMDFNENKITFKRTFNSPVTMELYNHGTRTELLTDFKGTIRIDENSMSQTMWLTKYFGDYNITKYDDFFVFEDGNNVLVFKLFT